MRVKKFLIGLVITLTLVLSAVTLTVKADSGWDTDYDSGSSWDSGGLWDSSDSWDSDYSHDSDYSSHSSSSGSASTGVALLIIAMFFIIFVVVVTKSSVPKRKGRVLPITKEIDNYNRLSEEEANKVISNFNIEEFQFQAYQIFYDTQIAWMNFDYDKLKTLLTDELYNTYLMDLEALKIKKQQNTMKDFELVESKLINLKEENGTFVATVILEVKFYDYIEDINSHKILRGNPSKKIDNTYIITLKKSKNIKLENCPSCGAHIEQDGVVECKYCKAKIVNNEDDFIMSKKEKISQK